MNLNELTGILKQGAELTEPTKLVATERRASSGHSLNQSIVQQFTREGNIRNRVRKASPNGLMAMTMWRLVRHWSTKYMYNSAKEPSRPAFFARARTASSNGIISSLGYRLGTWEISTIWWNSEKLPSEMISTQMIPTTSGSIRLTSPVFKMLLISSRNCSNFNCVSLNRNTVGVLFAPALFKTSCRWHVTPEWATLQPTYNKSK